MAALGFEVIFGALTVTGSFMAFAKLQELIPGRPITYRGQNVVNIALFVVTLGVFVYLIFHPERRAVFYVMVGLALLCGILMVLPIGGADMPVVISLLNSYAGLASVGHRLRHREQRADHRRRARRRLGLHPLDPDEQGDEPLVRQRAVRRVRRAWWRAASAKTAEGLTVREISAEDAAMQLAYARSVIVVPGYGMAVAQAQHAVRELADLIEKRGGEVKYAIHPVAGRMPGHMNVLLAEANVPYDQLVDMDEINDEFPQADVALVIGANDVVNPAARNDPASPIYGMPILNVDQAQKRHRAEAEHEPRLRRHRERAVLQPKRPRCSSATPRRR